LSLRKIFLLLAIFAFSNALAANFDFGGDSKSVGITSLMSAASNNDVEGARFFLRSDPDSIDKKNFGGATALHLAARQGNFEVAEILVKAGAKVDVIDNEGWTPLMRASLAANAPIVKLLIDNGADATQKNSVGESAIINSVNSRCDQCLANILQGQELLSKMDEQVLRKQLDDAYVIAQNHEDKKSQDLLSTYITSLDKQVIPEAIDHKPAVMVPVIAPGAVSAAKKNVSQQKQSMVKFKFVQGDGTPNSPAKKVLREEILPAPVAQDVVKVLQDNPNDKPVNKIAKRYIYNPTKEQNSWNDDAEISLNDAPVKKKHNYKFKSGKAKAAKVVAPVAPAAVVAPAVVPVAPQPVAKSPVAVAPAAPAAVPAPVTAPAAQQKSTILPPATQVVPTLPTPAAVPVKPVTPSK